MLKIIYLFSFFIFILVFFNIALSQTFEKVYKTDLDDYSSDAILLSDQSIVFIVNSGYYGYEYNTKIMKMSSTGVFIDSAQIQIPIGYISLGITDILTINDSTFIALGVCKNIQENNLRMLIVKFDFSLNIIIKTLTDFSIPVKYNVASFILNSDTNIISIGTDLENYFHFLYEFSTFGELINYHNYGNLANNPTFASSIIELDDYYHLYIFGYPQYFMIINKGTLEKDTVLHYTNTFEPFGIHKCINNDTYFVTGRNYIGNSIKTPAFIEVDNEGYVLSLNYYVANPDTNSGNRGKTFDFYNNKIFFASAYNFFVDASYPFVDKKQWIWLNRINDDYSIEWQRFYKGDANYMPTKVLATIDGGALILSTKYDWNDPIPNQRDLHILKVDSTGWYEGMTTGETEYDQPKQILVYPNPVKDKVNFVTGFYNNLELTIYNINGKLVHSSHLPHTQTINLQHLPTGMYAYIITGKNGFFEKGKLMKD